MKVVHAGTLATDETWAGTFVHVAFDVVTGQIEWNMMSVDWVTGLLVEDPIAGFLPPNNAEHQGEGFVTLSARPLKGLASGAEIRNQASIVFDLNEPIVTNEVLNVIDVGTPASAVAAIPAQSPSSIHVGWTGQDDIGGSGIASYDIYVSMDGGSFTPWMATSPAWPNVPPPYLDVREDHSVKPLDALFVINFLTRNLPGSPEGERILTEAPTSGELVAPSDLVSGTVFLQPVVFPLNKHRLIAYWAASGPEKDRTGRMRPPRVDGPAEEVLGSADLRDMLFLARDARRGGLAEERFTASRAIVAAGAPLDDLDDLEQVLSDIATDIVRVRRRHSR